MKEERYISLFGFGKTTQAIAKKLDNYKIFDDNVANITQKDGFTIYPASLFNPDKSILEIPSPGIPPYNSLIKKAKNLQSDYDFFLPSLESLLSIWISGTNGKTTTTKMLQHIFKDKNAQMGGNVGIPLSSIEKKASIYILETSSFTLHYTNLAKPDIYVLLPLSDDHISWHGSFDSYKQAKLKPLSLMKEGEAILLPYEFKDEPTNGFKIPYKNSNDLAKYFDIDIKKIDFREPFLLDAVLALGVSKILFDECDYALINSFKIDSHRLEEITDKKGRLWVNDSKGTNVHATLQAIKKYKDKKLYHIIGGDDKGADLTPLFAMLKKYNVTVFAIGSNKDKIIDLSNKYNLTYCKCDTLQNAVNLINKKLCLNEVALLSPAASSLDEYLSYKERGNIFKGLVVSLS